MTEIPTTQDTPNLPADEAPAPHESGRSRRRRTGAKARRTFGELLPATLRPWYQAARPRSLPATFAPLAMAGAMTLADGVFQPLRYLLALIGALLLQIASNYINEYVDFTKGADKAKTDGMGMVLSRGQLSPEQVRAGAIATTTGGIVIGLILTVMSGPALLLIGGIGVALVVFYTAGPFPLSRLGLGEVAVFWAFGPLMTLGAYFAVTGYASSSAFLAGLPIAFTVAAILHANNMRDMEADRAAGKRTLAVRFGQRGARLEFSILVYGAYVAGAALILAGVMPFATAIALITLPEALWLVSLTTRTNKPAQLHQAQARTARLHWWLGLSLTVGWLLYAAYLFL